MKKSWGYLKALIIETQRKWEKEKVVSLACVVEIEAKFTFAASKKTKVKEDFRAY